MIVILNNGTRIKISAETAQAIVQELLKSKEAADKWHCVMDTQKNQVSGFNLREAAAICSEEEILREPAITTLKYIGLFLDTLPVDDAHGRFWCEKFRRFVLDPKSVLV
jgi:hypothetical protein